VAAVALVGIVMIGAGVYEKVGPSTPPGASDALTAGRAVTVTAPTVTTRETELTLPAQALPFEQTILYPRVDGYVARWHVDRGAQVKAGQLLAEIDAPELDQQARQAAAALDRGRANIGQLKADRDQAAAEVEAATAQIRLAEADAALAQQELDRSATAHRSGVASRTDYDTAVRNRDAATAKVASAKADAAAKVKSVASREAALVTQEANVRTLEADLARLKELQQFKRIVAPFAGTVTRRTAEVGMLVTAGSGSPLFQVQDSSILRIQVDVPQRYAAAVRRAVAAQVLVPELPNRPLTAAVARTADALDPATRTLRVELDLPNPDRALLAGTFVRVRLRTPTDRPVVTIPVGTLKYTPEGITVAVVINGVVELRPVELGRDYGRTVEVATGLTGTERLVVNPADDLRGGETVRVVGERPADDQAGALGATWPAARK
jgi:RND family efflux transporter MFP subunit